MSTITDARASARGEPHPIIGRMGPDPLVVGADPLPSHENRTDRPISRRSFLGCMAALAGSALALGAGAGAAGPVAKNVNFTSFATLPPPVEPLSPALRRWIGSVASLLEDGLRDLGSTFVAVFDPRRGMIYFAQRDPVRLALLEEAGHLVLADDAVDQLRAILAADAEGGLHG
jgi:hypothetical protein